MKSLRQALKVVWSTSRDYGKSFVMLKRPGCGQNSEGICIAFFTLEFRPSQGFDFRPGAVIEKPLKFI